LQFCLPPHTSFTSYLLYLLTGAPTATDTAVTAEAREQMSAERTRTLAGFETLRTVAHCPRSRSMIGGTSFRLSRSSSRDTRSRSATPLPQARSTTQRRRRSLPPPLRPPLPAARRSAQERVQSALWAAAGGQAERLREPAAASRSAGQPAATDPVPAQLRIWRPGAPARGRAAAVRRPTATARQFAAAVSGLQPVPARWCRCRASQPGSRTSCAAGADPGDGVCSDSQGMVPPPDQHA
jgi:hypothetical protein